MDFKIRPARKEDCKDVSRMIMELAVFENMPDQVKISHEDRTHLDVQRLYNEDGNTVIFYNIDSPDINDTISSFFCRCHLQQLDQLELDGFCQNPFFECLIAEVPKEHKSKDGFTVVGYALYFYTYSTWKGRSVYLEDLYVMPEFRGNGIGKGLLSKVAQVGKEKQCVRLNLSVLDWNTSAREFYAAKGAQNLTESEGWHSIRFDKLNMENLAKETPND